MGAATLNRARPFGTISGDEMGRMYEQEHRYFMADGSAWVEPAPLVQADPAAGTAPAAKPAAHKKAKPAAEPLAQDAQLDAQMGGV